MVESNRGLTEVPYQHFSGDTEENHIKNLYHRVSNQAPPPNTNLERYCYTNLFDYIIGFKLITDNVLFISP
jgi:hypothetical protein